MEYHKVGRGDFEPWLDLIPDEYMLVPHDGEVVIITVPDSVCWCCGGPRIVEHFIATGEGNALMDRMFITCIDPGSVIEPCPYTMMGAFVGECEFKDRPDAACTTLRGRLALRPSKPR